MQKKVLLLLVDSPFFMSGKIPDPKFLFSLCRGIFSRKVVKTGIELTKLPLTRLGTN